VTQTATVAEGPLVLVGAQNGVTLIPSPTPLTRLNYFDGKFLRAEDLNREQLYLRSLVQLSNRAGGAGVVNGLTVSLASGGALEISAGLAIDPAGRVLYLPHDAAVGVAALIEASRQAAGSGTSGATSPAMGESAFSPCESATAPPSSVTTTFPTDLYLIAIAQAEALCGEEDVYGKLCEDACVTSTDRPYRLEGVVVRAIPLSLCPPTCTAAWLTAKHRRSQVASAYYATERALLGKLMSGARLRLDLWCQGAAGLSGNLVPLAVAAVNGGAVTFLDVWTARRERMESPPRSFWAWQMMMRPWSVFLAQVLQFQCQLHELLTDPGTVPGDSTDPCAEQGSALRDTVALLEEMEKSYVATRAETGEETDSFRPAFLTRIADLKSKGKAALEAATVPVDTRILINGGIVELPPAGYLPVAVGSVDVNTQVRRLLGEGVDLRFCVVRPDYVAHALEESQHMERICLLEGLDNPAAAPQVDILVPDGNATDAPAAQGHYFETSVAVTIPSLDTTAPSPAPAPPPPPPPASVPPGDVLGTRPSLGIHRASDTAVTTTRGPEFRGAGRSERLGGGGGAFHFAGLMDRSADEFVSGIAGSYTRAGASRPADGATAAAPAPDRAADDGDVFGIGGLARRALAAMRGGGAERSAAPRSVDAMASLSRLPPASTVNLSTVTPGVWVTMRCERDPFSLGVGESTPLRLEGAVGLSAGGIVVGAQLNVQGDLFCDQPTSSATSRRVKGRAQGWVWARTRVERDGEVSDNEISPRFIPVKAEVELRPATDGGGTLVVTVPVQEGVNLSVTTLWKGTPVLARLDARVDLLAYVAALLRKRAGSDPAKQKQAEEMIAQLEKDHPELHDTRLAAASLRENPGVAAESNAQHAASVRALRIIEAALDQDGFRDAATNLLFPPAPPATREKRVLATRDWVLFRRRRTSSCDCCQPETKVVAPPRRYQVYEITIPEKLSVGRIREVLASGADLSRLADVVGVAEFEGGTASLRTDTATLLQGWKAANPSDLIAYGALASVGAAVDDPDELGEQRAGRMADVVRGITPPDPTAEFDVLALVPGGLSAEGVDGVIVLFTVPRAVLTQTHRVYALPDTGMMDFVLQEIERGGLRTEILVNSADLGLVKFQAGTDTVLEDSLDPVRENWDRVRRGAPVGRSVVVLPTENAIPADAAETQGRAISKALRGDLTESTRKSAESVFDECDALTILEAGVIVE
jgi:hypothetical protein